MSDIAINNYLHELEKLRHYGGTSNESSIRAAFQNLLTTYAKAKDLVLVAEIRIEGKNGRVVTPDGTLKDSLRMDWGYWESKDQYDDLDEEIRSKFSKGYPNDNILFEDSKSAILIQNGIEKARTVMSDVVRFDTLLKRFVEYERPEVREFRKAIENFKEDVPKVTAALRSCIETDAESKPAYIAARDTFLLLCREVINPAITPEDIREMVIQHILTADIFNTIFDLPYYHSENNIAHELEQLTNTFFTKDVRQKTLAGIKHYYDTINARAAQIYDHHEKQRFLKVVYETFYKSYSPKKADRLGVVYTPNEIVNFMIDSTDYLLQKHFGKKLEDRGVEIMDPAVGTGTFICDLIDHISKDKLEYKYKNELHANEVEILPYYIANLNIEFTYKQKMEKYAEFENLCFVDTLDNYVNQNVDTQLEIGSVSDENADRIKRQNERKISVIIGNPPYNANQMNENNDNKNREYHAVDKRIKETYVKESTAQKTSAYDMYKRFYRWAMDRLDNNGILAFVTNRSFIDSLDSDGFRKIISIEFDYAYIIDTKSDVRQNPRIAGTSHNVFGIQTGVAIMFLIKKDFKDNPNCRISYWTMQDDWRKEVKLQWLTENKLDNIDFTNIIPDKDNNWINLVENDWDSLLPLSLESSSPFFSSKSVFNKHITGVMTGRDEWVYDYTEELINKKARFFVDKFNSIVDNKTGFDTTIKWSERLKRLCLSNLKIDHSSTEIIKCNYRPYVTRYYNSNKPMNDRLTSFHYLIFGNSLQFPNQAIAFSGMGTSKGFTVLSINKLFDYHFVGDTHCLPFSSYDRDGNRHDNITDWALQEFRQHYQNSGISKDDIFHYVYGVLHDPAYRKKYEINLKRSLPRLPWKADFTQWAQWGKALMDLHLGFETEEPYPLTEICVDKYPPQAALDNPQAYQDHYAKPKLKADKLNGRIIIDETFELSGIPALAWEYKLGNRSALEWILDQYKEKKPKDPTIAKLFNTYRFADYQDKVIDLLARVCTVSVKTMEIVQEMEKIID